MRPSMVELVTSVALCIARTKKPYCLAVKLARFLRIACVFAYAQFEDMARTSANFAMGASRKRKPVNLA